MRTAVKSARFVLGCALYSRIGLTPFALHQQHSSGYQFSTGGSSYVSFQVERYSTETGEWQNVSSLQEARSGHSVVTMANKIYALGKPNLAVFPHYTFGALQRSELEFPRRRFHWKRVPHLCGGLQSREERMVLSSAVVESQERPRGCDPRLKCEFLEFRFVGNTASSETHSSGWM